MAKKLVIQHQMTFIAVACGEEITVTNFAHASGEGERVIAPEPW